LNTFAQPAFLNQLLLVEGALTGREWLELTRSVEERAGRRRTLRGGPRTLDLDVILIEGETWSEPDWVVPHPALLKRPYLLLGSALLAPNWAVVPGGPPLREAARGLLHGSWGLSEVGRSGPGTG
ncbi:MAG: 2-amino-4-hydroxy-6-hydroxymethyldihydropteridine diphosphokinase, partial [Candidatus Dormibacteria bacterium]